MARVIAVLHYLFSWSRKVRFLVQRVTHLFRFLRASHNDKETNPTNPATGKRMNIHSIQLTLFPKLPAAITQN